MRRIKNWVIGGIENKIFNLILVTVILISAVFSGISINHTRMLSGLVAESGARQQESITEYTNFLMDTVIESNLDRTAQLETQVMSQMFEGARSRVSLLAQYAEVLFADPDQYEPREYAAPDPNSFDQLSAMVILPHGVDASDPDVIAKAGLIANMTDMMLAICETTDAETVYVGLPNGVFLTVEMNGSAWYENGEMIDYDCRSRFWYKQAEAAGHQVFCDIEEDVSTKELSVVCAQPVYGPDGALAAVVGTDVYLRAMQNKVDVRSEAGAFRLVVNQDGHVIYSPRQEGLLQVRDSAHAIDLRQTENAALSALVTDAMASKTDVRQVTLVDGDYYMIGVPMQVSGWTMLFAYSHELAGQPVTVMNERLSSLQEEAMGIYREKSGNYRNLTIVLFCGAVLLVLAGALILGKRIVRPLNRITKRISSLSKGDVEFKMEDAYRTGDEIQELAESFAAISHKTVEYMEEVRTVTAEKERIGTELALATNIQAAMLPHIFPAFPDRPDFDIYATMHPAKEVGGDFYDYFLIDPDHLCMVMADVSGKGVPAALFMMVSKIILQSVAMLGRSVGEILARTNESICTNNEAEMFVTVWIGILELSTGKLTAANAGHEYPAIKQPDGPFELYKDKHGFVIGGMEGVKYKEYELTLKPGAKLFVYTDGVAEATNSEEQLFGTERMLAALNEAPDAKPQVILGNVRDAVNRFVGDAPQFDDITMLCFEYKGPGKQ